MNEEKDPEVKDLSEDEAERLLDGETPDVSEEEEDGGTAAMTEDENGMPDWATIPPNVKMPKPGVQVAFLRIPAKWTSDPARGDRWCMCSPLTETEEMLAYNRARGNSLRSVTELSKQTIRVVDGTKANWSADGKPGSVNQFFSQIGAKGRQMVRNYYVRTHTVQDDEIADFFAKHFVSMTVG
jgi:hypothetical protein